MAVDMVVLPHYRSGCSRAVGSRIYSWLFPWQKKKSQQVYRDKLVRHCKIRHKFNI